MIDFKLKQEILKAQIHWASLCFASYSPSMAALDLLGDLQHSADPLVISSCPRHMKRHLAFYKLNLEHKNGGITKCLKKPLNVIFL